MGLKSETTPKQTSAEPMSDRQALDEAQRRWGESGRAWHPAYVHRGDHYYCTVGGAIGDVREEWQVFGRGRTWEEAFADATTRKH